MNQLWLPVGVVTGHESLAIHTRPISHVLPVCVCVCGGVHACVHVCLHIHPGV